MRKGKGGSPPGQKAKMADVDTALSLPFDF
jgi:hypothetical protein